MKNCRLSISWNAIKTDPSKLFKVNGIPSNNIEMVDGVSTVLLKFQQEASKMQPMLMTEQRNCNSSSGASKSVQTCVYFQRD
jgi:hypothetical protein